MIHRLGFRDYEKVGPLLTTAWHQDAPFNNHTPIINGEHAPAGCVPIAIAQVVNYHQRLDGENIAWDRLQKGACLTEEGTRITNH